MRVGERERSDYERHGFTILDYSLDSTDVLALRDALEAWPGREGAAGAYGILKNNLWREVPSVLQLIADTGLPAIACDLLDTSEVVLFQDNLVWKPPGGARIEWHQDYSYWPLDRPRGVTLWIAVDDADVDNGCMHYVPGTHRRGERQPADFITGSGQPQRTDLPPLDWEAREKDAVAAWVKRGQVLAHHPLVWHMSPPNVSDRPRRALTITWIAPDVRWDPRHAPHPYNYALEPVAGTPVLGESFPRFTAPQVPDPS